MSAVDSSQLDNPSSLKHCVFPFVLIIVKIFLEILNHSSPSFEYFLYIHCVGFPPIILNASNTPVRRPRLVPF